MAVTERAHLALLSIRFKFFVFTRQSDLSK
jgi:hypothetical protein